MIEKYLKSLNISKEELLKLSKKIKLNQKEFESLEKGKEFVDKQMELPNDAMRQEIAIVLLAYTIEKYNNS